MNLFRKIVTISFCALGIIDASLHAAAQHTPAAKPENDLAGAYGYMQKAILKQKSTDAEAESFWKVREALFFHNFRELPEATRMQLLAFNKALLNVDRSDMLDRIYLFMYPGDAIVLAQLNASMRADKNCPWGRSE